jgi:hypothetical protein
MQFHHGVNSCGWLGERQEDSQDWLSDWFVNNETSTPLGVFSEVLILKGFKSFVLKVFILKKLGASLAELFILKGLEAGI